MNEHSPSCRCAFCYNLRMRDRKMNYTRRSLLETIKFLREADEGQIIAQWKKTANLTFVKDLEAVPQEDFCDVFLNMVARAALIDLKKQEWVHYNEKDGLFSVHIKPQLNSLDSDWNA